MIIYIQLVSLQDLLNFFPVSYTHLDVYKRQDYRVPRLFLSQTFLFLLSGNFFLLGIFFLFSFCFKHYKEERLSLQRKRLQNESYNHCEEGWSKKRIFKIKWVFLSFAVIISFSTNYRLFCVFFSILLSSLFIFCTGAD